MNFRIGIFHFLLGVAVLPAAFFPQSLYGEDKVYIVQKGETLYSIARAEGIRVDELMRYNGITDSARLMAGQRLKIPSSGTAAGRPAAAGTVSSGFSDYRVARGDTLYSIARKFSVSVGAIEAANSLSKNYLLREGDSLRIPGGAGTGAAPSAASAGVVADSTAAAGAGTSAARNPGGQPAPAARGNTAAGKTPLDSSVRWPVDARELSYMTGKLSGVVITGTRSESVESLTRGTVLAASPYRGFGKVVIVQVEGGYLYVYGGCESLSVKEGDRLGPGAEIGKLGIDAVSNKPHLFFMVYKSNAPIDPAKAPRA